MEITRRGFLGGLAAAAIVPRSVLEAFGDAALEESASVVAEADRPDGPSDPTWALVQVAVDAIGGGIVCELVGKDGTVLSAATHGDTSYHCVLMSPVVVDEPLEVRGRAIGTTEVRNVAARSIGIREIGRDGAMSSFEMLHEDDGVRARLLYRDVGLSDVRMTLTPGDSFTIRMPPFALSPV